MINKTTIFLLALLWLIMTSMSCNSTLGEAKSPSPPEVEYYTLRIMTYNIYHGEKTNGDIDMDRFAEIINNESPDLVALQEVDKGVERSGRIDITAELGDLTGLEGYFFKFRDFQGGDYGNAILSRFPIAEIDIVEGYRIGTHGVVLPFAKVEIDDGTFIFFNSSHLSAKHLEEREIQTQQLAHYYKDKIDNAPLLICGDLNAEPNSPEMEVLFEEFVEADTTFAHTFSTRTGMRKKIDYILHPDNENWEVIETKTVCAGDASDHCAFFAVLRFKKAFR